MASTLTLLTVLLTLMNLPGNLKADGNGSSMTVTMNNFEVPAVVNLTNEMVALRTKLQNHTQQVTQVLNAQAQNVAAGLQQLKNDLEYLKQLSTLNCRDTPTYSSQHQDDVPSPHSGEQRQLVCNSPTEGNNMLTGIQDDNEFSDLDEIKCVHYDSVQLGEESNIKVPTNSTTNVTCGPNEVMTGFGANDEQMEHVVRAVCRNVTAGAKVTTTCQDVTVHANEGTGQAPPAYASWPVQCLGDPLEINVVTGVVFNSTITTTPTQKWNSLRCCRLKRTLSFGEPRDSKQNPQV